MKLFIWTDFCSDYTEGLAFAIAKNETEARKQIVKKMGSDFDLGWDFDWGKLEIRPLNKRVARYVCGGG